MSIDDLAQWWLGPFYSPFSGLWQIFSMGRVLLFINLHSLNLWYWQSIYINYIDKVLVNNRECQYSSIILKRIENTIPFVSRFKQFFSILLEMTRKHLAHSCVRWTTYDIVISYLLYLEKQPEEHSTAHKLYLSSQALHDKNMYWMLPEQWRPRLLWILEFV